MKSDPSREHVFVYARLHSCHVFSMKVKKKNTQKAFLNEKFIQKSLCLRLRKKHVYLETQDERRASDLKEQQLQFKASLSSRPGHVFQIFRKNCSEYKESVN